MTPEVFERSPVDDRQAQARQLEYLLRVTHTLARLDDPVRLQEVACKAARTLLGSDGAALLRRESGFCHYVAEDALAPLWQGQRFREADCIGGWVMRQRRPVGIADVLADARLPREVYGASFVRSLAMAPLDSDDPTGALGVYWAEPHQPTPDELKLLQLLADSVATAQAGLRRQRKPAPPDTPLAGEPGTRVQYHTVFSYMTEGFALGKPVYDAAGKPADFRFLEINAAFRQHTGLDQRIVGLPALQYAPRREQIWVERFAAVAESRQSDRFTAFNADSNRHYEVYCFSPEPGMFAVLFRDVSGQVALERKLHERERYLEQMINTLPGLIWTTNAGGEADFVSSQWLAYTGATFASQLGFGWTAAVHPDDLERISTQWREVIAQRVPHTAEFRIRRHDGEYRWFVARSAPIFVADGECSGWFGICTDIHDLKCTQQALVESEQALGATFEQASAGMVNVGLDGHLLRVNPRYCEILGYNEAELVGKHLDFLAYGPDVSVGRDQFRQVVSGEVSSSTVVEKRYQRRDRSVIWVRITGTTIRGRDGRPRYVLGIVEDITERRRGEEERELLLQELRSTAEISRRSRLELETFFNQAAVGMALVDVGGHLSRVNRRFCEIAGYQEKDLLGRSIQSIIHPDDLEESRRHTDELLHGQRSTSTLEKRFIRRNGEMIWVSSTSSLTRAEDGAPQFCIRVVQDISARKQLEQQVAQVQRELEARVEQRTAELLRINEALQSARLAAEEARLAAEAASRAKSDFLATMSHEIRTPLNGVIGMTSLLLDSPLALEQYRHVEVIRRSGESLLHLLNDFLEFSRIESGHLRLEPMVFDLAQIFEECLALVRPKAAGKGLKLCAEIDAPPWLLGDGARLRQILLNFLSNAVKFTEAGNVVLRVRSLPADAEELWLRFEVEDTGIGIEAEMLARLFEPFTQADSSTTRRHEGTGLGLAICRRLADLLGGQVGARTLPGRGSVFWLEVPLQAVPAEEWPVLPVRNEVQVPRLPAGRWRVLVVEDNPVNQLTAVAMLKRLGCLPDVVGNGQEAVEALQQVPYDLVLMDCDMPVLDGFEATRVIRGGTTVTAALPIVAMTANVMQGEREKCLAAGMNDYLPKPVRLADLEAMLKRWLPGAA